MTDHIVLEAGANRLEIATLGAEMRSWRLGGREILWQGDPKWWPERSPILFPVVGWTRGGESRVGGRTYPLGLHGFARRSVFSAEQTGDRTVRMRLEQSAETLAQYPFGFALTADYAIDETSIDLTLTVRNTGDEPMPYAVGVHPGFLASKASARLVFDAAEEARVPVIAPGGLISDRRRTAPLQDGRVLPLDDSLFPDDALCFMDVRSRWLDLSTGEGATLRIGWRDYPNVVVWSKPGAPFVCVETWTGSGDPEGFTGDLFEKPGMIVLQPGETRAHGYVATVL
ncbi:aldose 1-epimerase [Alsobacter metallidurans]|uniref:Aldose 1-epimerase n=1 Tax=Alsobacter metallidurans TaxID=340221 RepID=A0A917MHM8_9HYPH|nr:aldose 1-epimerase family protein [Alsobacter metallidurans]GGH18665.1 aldose 1-epimerase [Alsobacter metallidurans]